MQLLFSARETIATLVKYKCKTFITLTPGVNFIKALHLYFTRVAIACLTEKITALVDYKCKTFIKLTPG